MWLIWRFLCILGVHQTFAYPSFEGSQAHEEVVARSDRESVLGFAGMTISEALFWSDERVAFDTFTLSSSSAFKRPPPSGFTRNMFLQRTPKKIESRSARVWMRTGDRNITGVSGYVIWMFYLRFLCNLYFRGFPLVLF